MIPTKTKKKMQKRLLNFVQPTLKARKVGKAAAKFDLISFSQEASKPNKFYVEKDSDQNLIVTETEDGKTVIKAGTVDKLIQKLTGSNILERMIRIFFFVEKNFFFFLNQTVRVDATVTDMTYVNAFLLTYRSFTTPTYLLEQLINTYKYHEKPDRKQTTNKEEYQLSQIRVCAILKKWLEVHFSDFIEDNQLTTSLMVFIDSYLVGKKKMGTNM